MLVRISRYRINEKTTAKPHQTHPTHGGVFGGGWVRRRYYKAVLVHHLANIVYTGIFLELRNVTRLRHYHHRVN